MTPLVLTAAILLAACGGTTPPPFSSPAASTPASPEPPLTSPPPPAVTTLSWHRLTPPGSLGASFARYLAFSPTTIILAGLKLDRSTDGGRSWQTAMNGFAEERLEFRDIAFTGSRWLALTEKELYASDDDGVTWSVVSVPGVPAQEANPPRAWRSLKRQRGTTYLVGGSMTLQSRDEGRTWMGVPGPPPFTSMDEGRSWERKKYTGDTTEGALRERWEVPGAALGSTSTALYRVTPAGVATKVYDGRVRALATSGNAIVALTATHVIRSADAGRTFTEQRPSGLGGDIVNAISASGRQIAVVANGPTAFVSDDAGKTWSPGPDLGELSDGVVAGSGAFLFHGRAGRASWLWRATSVTGPWARVPLPEGVSGSVELLGAEGASIAIANKLTAYLTTDAGDHWTSLGDWPLPLVPCRGLVRGSEVFDGGLDGVVRSRAGAPFEDVTRHFIPVAPRMAPNVMALFHEGDTTYALAQEGLYAWSRARDAAADLTQPIALGPSHDWLRIEDGAVHGNRILVTVGNRTLTRLMHSPDHGKTWVEVKAPKPDGLIGALAHTDTGFLIGQGGLWIEAPE